MNKVLGLLALVLMVCGHQAQALDSQTEVNHSQVMSAANIVVLQKFLQIEAATSAGLKWKVGDKASHKLSGGILNGTSESVVREDTGAGFWMQQDIDLGFLGKQKIEILFDKATGQVQKILANGQEQQIPDTKDIEVVEMKEDHIRVAAGEFDCIYAKIKNKKDNQIQEAWMNPQLVPMSGMIKSVSDSQFGKISQELTSYHKN